MKRLIITALAVAALLAPAEAQDYRYSRYYNYDTGRLDYGRHDSGLGTGNMYYGFRIGPAFSFVNSDDPSLDGGKWQTGLSIGALVGLPLSQSVPLYAEIGLQYTEKGGRKRLSSNKKMTYDLNYIEPARCREIHLPNRPPLHPSAVLRRIPGLWSGRQDKELRAEGRRSARSPTTPSSVSTEACAWAAEWATTCSTWTCLTTSACQTSATTRSTRRTTAASRSISE